MHKDRFNAVYFVLLAFGMGSLFAYNSFIASPEYMTHLYRYASGDEDANTTMLPVWEKIETLIVVTSMVPNFALQGAILSERGQRLPLHPRMMCSALVQALAIAIVAVMPAFHVNEHVALGCLLGATAVSSVTAALFQNSMFGLAACFPPSFMQGVMLGQGISGSTVSLLQIVTKASFGGDAGFDGHRKQAYLFFGLGIAWMLVCTVLVAVLPRIPFARHYAPQLVASAPRCLGGGGGVDRANCLQNAEALLEADDADVVEMNSRTAVDPDASPVEAAEDRSESIAVVSTLSGLLGVIKLPLVAIFFTFYVSLLVFPGIGVLAAPGDEWFGIIIVALFNFGDTIGRFLPKFQAIRLSSRTLFIAGFARLLLIPLFILCVRPRLLPSPWIPWALMLTTGITNGLVGSLAMMSGPGLVAAPSRARAGSAMSLSLLAGASAGSLTSLGVTAGLTHT